LHGKVSDEDILFLINKFIPHPAEAQQADCDQLVQRLIDEANDNGGQDNITAILVTAQ
jgi:protein phosphatase